MLTPPCSPVARESLLLLEGVKVKRPHSEWLCVIMLAGTGKEMLASRLLPTDWFKAIHTKRVQNIDACMVTGNRA